MKTYSMEIRKAEATLERAEKALTVAKESLVDATSFHSLAASDLRRWKRLAVKAASEEKP